MWYNLFDYGMVIKPNWNDYVAMERIEESYNNAFDLLVGNTNWDELSKKGSFMLPIDYEDTNALLKHFESIEDYEKCAIIRDETIRRYIQTLTEGSNN